jgi:hypothetical protein
LKTSRNAIAHRLFGYFEPNYEIKRSAQPGQDRHQALRLREGSGKSVKDKSMTTVQAQPIFNKFNDNFIRNEFTMLDNFGGFLPKRGPEVFFPAQNRAR